MKIYLILISLLFTVTSVSAQTGNAGNDCCRCQKHCQKTANDTCGFLPNGKVVKYNIVIQRENTDITGICIIKRTNDSIMGTVMNEFGIKAFDFIMSTRNQEIELDDVMAMLDKWYIKKVLRDDLKFILTCEGKSKSTNSRVLTVNEDMSMEMNNLTYKLKYILKPLDTSAQAEESEGVENSNK